MAASRLLQVLCFAAALVPSAVGVAAAQAKGAPAGDHTGLTCDDCHPLTPDEHLPCEDCHGPEENLHPDAVTPSRALPEPFPLVDGRLGCVSCHQLHEPTGPYALRGFASGLAANLQEFCAACHGDRLMEANPHLAEAAEARCAYCHAAIDLEAVLSGEPAKPRADADRLCNFCHEVGTKDHPRNIDPVLDLPASLPRSDAGEITCTTCHSPHGSSQYTHYIRPEYAEHFERGRQENPHRNDRFSCRACHVEPRPGRLTATAHELRMGGDAILLCISCHVTARSHHPVGMPLDPGITARLQATGGLPLDDAGRMTCVTCHSNNCETDEQRMSVRHYDAARMSLALCWRCHPKEEFAETDPHRKRVDDQTDGCVFCHDRPPVKGLEKAEDLYFVSQVKMICIRCHEDLSDQDVSHMGKVPTETIRARLTQFARERNTEFPLAKDGGFTCTTCHNAHFSSKDATHRTRLPSREMCALCHRR